MINFNYVHSTPGTTYYEYDKMVTVAMHELGHVLAMSPSLFGKFVDPITFASKGTIVR